MSWGRDTVLPKTIAGRPLRGNVIVCARVPLGVYSSSEPALPLLETPAHCNTTTLPAVNDAALAETRPRRSGTNTANFFIGGLGVEAERLILRITPRKPNRTSARLSNVNCATKTVRLSWSNSQDQTFSFN